ncbi:MAG: Uncharacterized protein FD162_2067 [Rhodobacteraceae bacterium]|nr:MAG: Uncharacterized protein FD162_2067 [Paracoccaceae bacterium]
MMKRPSLCLIRCRCPLGTCMALICSQRNRMPNSANSRPASLLKAGAVGGGSQADAERLEHRLPFVRHVDAAVGALSP